MPFPFDLAAVMIEVKCQIHHSYFKIDTLPGVDRMITLP